MKNLLKNTLNPSNVLPLALGGFLFIYLALRAALIPITDDEYISMHYHVSQDLWALLTTGQPNQGWAPNNHVLNSLLIKLEIGILGKHDWSVRLHSLASFVLCYAYVWRLLKRVTPSVTRQFLYLLFLFLNPYLLDFFSLARGYALSFAGWSMAFYYFIAYTQQPSNRNLWATMVGLFVAVWSNFSAIYYLMIFGLMFLNDFYRHQKAYFNVKHLLYWAISYVLIGIIIAVPLYRTVKSGETFGGTEGLFKNSVVSYVERFLYFNPRIGRFEKFNENVLKIEVYGGVLILIWGLLQVASFKIKTSDILKRIQFYAVFQFLGIAILAKVFFILFKTPYPMDRTNLLFAFPFFISFIAAFEVLIHKIRHIQWFWGAIVAFYIWHFALCMNLENTREWWQSGDAKRVLSYLKTQTMSENRTQRIRLGAEGYQYFSLSFYAETQYNDMIHIGFSEIKNDENWDYFFAPLHKKDEVWKSYHPIVTFKHGVLFKRND